MLNLLPKELLMNSKARQNAYFFYSLSFRFWQISLNAAIFAHENYPVHFNFFQKFHFFTFLHASQLFFISILYYLNFCHYNYVLISFKDSCLFNLLLQVCYVMYCPLQFSELRYCILKGLLTLSSVLFTNRCPCWQHNKWEISPLEDNMT